MEIEISVFVIGIKFDGVRGMSMDWPANMHACLHVCIVTDSS